MRLKRTNPLAKGRAQKVRFDPVSAKTNPNSGSAVHVGSPNDPAFCPLATGACVRGTDRPLLGAHELPALVAVDELIAGVSSREDLGRVRLGIILRYIAEPLGVGIIIPAAGIARDAIDDLKVNVRG